MSYKTPTLCNHCRFRDRLVKREIQAQRKCRISPTWDVSRLWHHHLAHDLHLDYEPVEVDSQILYVCKACGDGRRREPHNCKTHNSTNAHKVAVEIFNKEPLSSDEDENRMNPTTSGPQIPTHASNDINWGLMTEKVVCQAWATRHGQHLWTTRSWVKVNIWGQMNCVECQEYISPGCKFM